MKGSFEHVCIIAAEEHGIQIVPKECDTKADDVELVDMLRTEPSCEISNQSICSAATKR